MDTIIVFWDADMRWCVEACRRGEYEAATGDVAGCYRLSYKRAVKLGMAAAVARKVPLEVFGRNGKRAFVRMPVPGSNKIVA